MISGQLTIDFFYQQWFAAGDTLYYDSIIPHNVYVTSGSTGILTLVYAPL